MKTEAANPHPAKDAPYLPNVSFLDTRVSMTSTMRGVKTRGKASAVQQLSTKGVQRCVDPHLSGFRAAAWVAQWDRGNRATRRHVLEGFIALHSNSNISAVEADLGDGAALFFARMTSTLKLSYKTLAKEPSLGKTVLPPPSRPRHSSASTAVASPNAAETTATSLGCTSNSLNMSLPPRPSIGRRPTLHDEPQTKAPSSTNANAAPTFLLLLIEALTVFVRGNQYLTLLVETGMAAALTDCLECGTQPQPIVQTSLFGNASPPEEMERAAAPSPYVRLSVEERKSVVLLLLFAANAGRVYREMLSDEECLVCLIHTLQRETEKEIASLLTELLILLGQGNPHTAPLIHSGLVRVILSYCAFELRRSESAVENILATPHDATVILSAVRGQEETSSPDVVVLAARALRDLQLGKEVHHYNSFYSFSDGGQEVCDNPHDQRRLNMMPVVGLGGDVNALSYEVPRLPPTASPSRILLSELNTEQFLAGICYMILHDTNIRLQVEGTEIMVLVSKNITLIRPILVRLFDVLDDDRLTIVDEDDTVAMAHCHRRQLSCGRAAVQVMLAKPMTPERRSIILDVIALRSAHMTLLKYLRIADSGEKAAVGLCCQAVQMLARASEEQQSPQTTLQSTPRGGSTSATVSASLIKMGRFIRESLGDALYQVLLHQQVTEDESFAMLRAARASASLCFRGAWGGAGSGQ